MAARAEAEANNAARDKTLPAPPVPSRRLLGAQEIFKDNTADTPTDVPRTPSISALSLLRPPHRHDQGPLPKQEDGLDALERRLVEQVGTRRLVPPPAAAQAADPPPAPVPLPIAVSRVEVPNGGVEMNESAIPSLALGAEESFGGRNGNGNGAAAATEDLDAELEAEDPLDARTQRLSKGGATAGGGAGGGGSSGNERGTHKARSRKSFKSDRDRGKEREEKKAMRKKRDGGRDEEAVRMKRAAKGRVAEWLEKLASPEQEPEQEPKPEPELEPESASAPSPLKSKPNPRSSGFVSVTTLRRAPIILPQPADSTPDAQAPRKNVLPIWRVANRYPPPPPSQEEMKYNVKSARGGRGGRVTAVASIWAEASKGGGSATVANVSPPKPKPKASASTSIPAPKPITKPDLFISRGRAPTPAKSEDAPARAPAQRALFSLGVAAAATPSSPALSSSIATPDLSSTASLAQPPGAPRARARARAITPTPEPESVPVPAADSRCSPSPQLQQQQGWKAPLVSGAGLKADLAFGQARLHDLIRRYQGQAT